MMVKSFVERVLAGLLLDVVDDGGGGGTDTSVADNNGDHKPEDKAAKPESGVKPGAAPDKTADDARYKGILADLQKERKARQQFETDLASARTEVERERKRVLALAGVNPRSKEEDDADLVRERLKQINPALGDLTADDLKDLRDLKAQLKEMQAATTHTWASHGRKMLGSVTEGVQKALGGKLTDRQEARIKRAYVQEAESDPEFLARHEAGDPKLVEEFVKGWLEDFVEPAKRAALATEVGRRSRVPSGKDRSIVGSGEKPIDVNDPKAVEDFLVKGFRERGGQFRR